MRTLAQRTRPLTKSLLPFLGNLKITTLLLAWLAFLVFWGTLYQAKVGVYFATARFFDSWWLWVGDWVPLPATRTLLLLLSVNLIAGMIVRLPRHKKALGLWLIHGGFIFLLGGGLWSSLVAQEGKLWLQEGAPMKQAVQADGSLWELPFELSLVRAQELLYPGTQQAKFYHARVRIRQGLFSQEADLSLNAPWRFEGYSLYIISFNHVQQKPRVGLLVSKNPARWLPYLFSITTGLGLLIYGIQRSKNGV